MFPLSDSIPRVHRPYAVWAIIVLNAAVFIYVQLQGQDRLFEIFHLYGVVPARITDPQWANWVGYPPSWLQSLFTYMFLHGGWMHFILNMWTLWIFADNIEDVMGPWRFLGFYLASGLAALSLHLFFNPGSQVPVVGASGAVSGVMGAYFLLYPHSKVTTLFIIIIFPYIIDIPALLYLGIWLAMQIFSGLASFDSQAGGGVAWWAHAGGFAAGMALLPVFRKPDRCYYCFKK